MDSFADFSELLVSGGFSMCSRFFLDTTGREKCELVA